MQLDPEAGAGETRGIESAWRGFSSEGDFRGLATAWVDRLWKRLPHCGRCFLLWIEPSGHFMPLAVCPGKAEIQDLIRLLPQTIEDAGPSVIRAGESTIGLVPVVLRQQVIGVLVVELSGGSDANEALEMILWGSGWLALWAYIDYADSSTSGADRGGQLLAIQAALLAEDSFPASALAATNAFGAQWRSVSAFLGWARYGSFDIVARSHASGGDEKANLLRSAVAAMEEGADLGRTVQWSASSKAQDSQENLPEHRAFALETRSEAVVTVPLFVRGETVGALLFEFDRPLTGPELEELDTQCMMIAPLLAQKHAADRTLWQHLRDSVSDAGHWFADGSNPGWKLAGGALALLLLLAAVAPIPFRVTAPSVVEGEVQRAAVAPFQGYIREAPVRAGDAVRQGQVLARLEDKDLQLERVRWASELEVAQRKEREAMAAANRVDLRLASAQANQARAQLALAEEKLRRSELIAPFDGVVVKGDLSQQLGSPVEQGKVLFEIAPLDAWRVVLKVDDRDIAHLKAGQTGRLLLVGLPGNSFPVTVRRITAVATAEEGRNYFRVEAELGEGAGGLRPGMEGVAKVDAGSHSALWVWTHRFTHWLRLTLWEWLP